MADMTKVIAGGYGGDTIGDKLRPIQDWCPSVAVVALLHVLQLGLLWRYCRLLASTRWFPLAGRELANTAGLRLAHATACSLPALLVSAYSLLTPQDISHRLWPVLACACASLLSCVWALALYEPRGAGAYCCVVSAVCPSTPALVLKLTWRLAEVSSRVLSLVLFAAVQGYWVVLVAGCHWLTVLILNAMHAMLSSPDPAASLNTSPAASRVPAVLAASVISVFSYFPPSTAQRSRWLCVVQQVLVLLETAALLGLWLVYDSRTALHLPLAATTALLAVTSTLAVSLYHACFPPTQPGKDSPSQPCLVFQCLECSKPRSPSTTTNTRPKPWEPAAGGPLHADPMLLPARYDLPPGHHNLPHTHHDLALVHHDLPQVDNNMSSVHHKHKRGSQVANVRALDTSRASGYLSGLAGRGRLYHDLYEVRGVDKTRRSQTPLVLMGGVRGSQQQRPGASRHQRAGSLDFLWDNYDLQQYGEGLHAGGGDVTSPLEQGYIEAGLRVVTPGGGELDQGYYSALSSSSQRRRRADNLSDGNTSSYSTTSTAPRRPPLNCRRCGTSVTAPAPAGSARRPRRRASIHTTDRRPGFGRAVEETLQEAMARVYGAGLPLHGSIQTRKYEYTGSEI